MSIFNRLVNSSTRLENNFFDLQGNTFDYRTLFDPIFWLWLELNEVEKILNRFILIAYPFRILPISLNPIHKRNLKSNDMFVYYLIRWLFLGGHFVCKLFDIFTPFSVGLVYLMYRTFNQISIHKPVTSRPANSER